MRRIWTTVVACITAGVLLVGCGEKEDVKAERKPVRPVIVGQVRKMDVLRTVNLTGRVVPVEDTVISAEVAGTIVTRAVDLGSEVKENDVLANIDDKDYKKAHEQAIAMLQVANASLEQNKATQRQLQEDQETNERLYKQNVISKKALDDITTRLAEVNALVKLSEAKVQEATIARDVAKRNLEKATVKCPLKSALVAEVMFEKGTYAVPGTPLVRLVNIDDVWIEVGVGEKLIDDVEQRVDQARAESEDKKAYAKFTVPTTGEEEYRGSVEHISPYADPKAGAYKLRIRYKNTGHALKGGMLAVVDIPINTRHGSIVVPREAVLTEGSRTYVFTLNTGEKLRVPLITTEGFVPSLIIREVYTVRKMEVSTGVVQNEEVEITRGLVGDETVVVDGAAVLRDRDYATVLKGLKARDVAETATGS